MNQEHEIENGSSDAHEQDQFERLDNFRVTRWLHAKTTAYERVKNEDGSITTYHETSHSPNGEKIDNETWVRRELELHEDYDHAGYFKVTAGDYVAIFRTKNDDDRSEILSYDWDSAAANGKLRW